jgi:small subunit ribosomal protein S16
MRLRRTGAKKQPRYRVVIADARAPRDGASVDTIGFYDPLTEPATIRIDADRVQHWLDKGVKPSDTVARLLRRSGLVDWPEPVYPEKKPPKSAAAAPAATPAAAAPAPAAPAAEAEAPAVDADATVAMDATDEAATEAAPADEAEDKA